MCSSDSGFGAFALSLSHASQGVLQTLQVQETHACEGNLGKYRPKGQRSFSIYIKTEWTERNAYQLHQK